MFRYAVEWDYLARNPFDGVRAIRVGKRCRRDWHYLQPDEYRALLDATPDLRWKVFYALAYTSGARFGELFNLLPANVDFDRQVFVIKNREGTNSVPPFQIKDYKVGRFPFRALRSIWYGNCWKAAPTDRRSYS